MFTKILRTRIWDMLRMGIAFIFLWAFFDKTFGLGFATSPDKSWLSGVSPTAGYLQFGTSGLFKSFFQSLSGNTLVDFLFMFGLLYSGTGLLSKKTLRYACYAGSILMFLIYLSGFPPKNNPIIDEHLIYILVLLGISAQSNK